MAATPHPTPMLGRTQPARDDVLRDPRLRVAAHPLLEQLLTTVRDIATPGPEFSRAIQEITRYLAWDALRDAPVVPVEVPGHTGELVRGARLRDDIAAVAMLRAGIAMVAPVQMLIPQAPIYQVGVRRNEATLLPAVYYTNLPPSTHDLRHILLLDPMLATGGSAVAVVERIRQTYHGAITFLGVIGAPLGVQQLLAADPQITVLLAALDDGLNERGYIVPGLGDAGDRTFGTT